MQFQSVHMGRRRSALSRSRAQGQRGAVLIVVLVVLTLMFLAGLGVMRAADSGNVLAGNFSFQQGAIQASDRAVTEALSVVASVVPLNKGNNDVENRYLSNRATGTGLDARGIPTAIDWTAVSCVDENGVGISDCSVDAGNYRVQFVVERLCISDPDFSNIKDIRGKCEYEANTTAVDAATISLRYRALIRVRGPRGTESWFEAMLSGPAST